MMAEGFDDRVEVVLQKLNLDEEAKLACNADGQQEVHDTHEAEDDDGQMLCPICLDSPELAEVAVLHGCGHTYCVTCILRWASRKDNGATCPQCKAAFSHVVTHRKPSGTLVDFPDTVAVADLLDSCWFAYHKRQLEKGKAPVAAYAEHDDYDEYDYGDYDDDQEVEDFFMSSAAGRARIVLGNRRFGDGGYVSSGRRNARPVQQQHTKASGKKPAKGSSPAAQGGHKHAQGASPAGSSSGCSPSPSSSSGRRARRNARRKAMDELHGAC